MRFSVGAQPGMGCSSHGAPSPKCYFPQPVMAGYVLGPVTGDHWFVYIADKCDRPDYTATDRTVRFDITQI